MKSILSISLPIHFMIFKYEELIRFFLKTNLNAKPTKPLKNQHANFMKKWKTQHHTVTKYMNALNHNMECKSINCAFSEEATLKLKIQQKIN